jgi:subtilisin family serine protease
MKSPLAPASRSPALLLVGGTLIGLLLAASTAAAGPDVDVAVLDTGIDPAHPAFCDDQVGQWTDLVNGRPAPYDDNGHGTAVASRVGANASYAAFPCVDLHVYKVLDAGGVAPFDRVAEAIRTSVDDGAEVVSLQTTGSIPYPPASAVVADAVDDARDRGVLVVTSAGNRGNLPPPSPASAVGHGPSEAYPGSSSPDALVVGASDGTGNRTEFSQRNPELLADGEDVTVAAQRGGTVQQSGTSFSTPWMAGAAARLVAAGGPSDPDWLEWVLLHAADGRLVVPYANEGYGAFGAPELSTALAVAIGEGAFPSADHRDAEHAASLGVQMALNGQASPGALHPDAG